MSNLTLQRFDRDGIELVIDTATGESFASISGYARMSGKHKDTISTRLTAVVLNSPKTAEVETKHGFKSVVLITEDLICEWLPKDNPEMATQLLKLGVRSFLHTLAGYEIKSTAVEHKIPQTYAEALLEAGRLALENEKLAAQNEQLSQKILEDAPKVALAEAIAFSDDSIEFHEYAKMIGTGRTRLFRKMRDAGVIMQNSTIPYQRFIDAGYFEVSQEITPNGKLVPFALVTGKGQIWLKQRLDHYETIEKRAISLITAGV